MEKGNGIGKKFVAGNQRGEKGLQGAPGCQEKYVNGRAFRSAPVEKPWGKGRLLGPSQLKTYANFPFLIPDQTKSCNLPLAHSPLK